MTDSSPRPDFPKPKCRVVFVAGPPAAGKSSYVRKHAASCDIVIDFDAIGYQMGVSRERSSEQINLILAERNRRLAALADEPPQRTAWVIVTAPSRQLRKWWGDALGAKLMDRVLVCADRQICRERVRRDPTRRGMVNKYLRAIDQWFEREKNDDPGWLAPGCDANGYPRDQLHPWNAT
jgi:hypothetical protein